MMSTSDAALSELRAEPAQHGAGRARSAAAREKQDESFQRFDEKPIGRQSFPSATRQEAAHTGPVVLDDSVRREEETLQWDSKIHRPVRTTFTSSLYLQLYSVADLRANSKPDLRANQNPDVSLHSSTPKAEAENRSCQINGQTSEPDSTVKVFTDPTSSGQIRFSDRRTIKDCIINQTSPNGKSGSHERGELHLAPFMKYYTKSDKQTDPFEAANPPRTMLSSSVVTVLAPHWSGKLRRGKRFEGTSNPEAQGALQDVTNSATNREYERFQGTMDRSPIHRSHEPLRVPFPGTRRNTESWSTKSGPASLDYESRRKMSHTVSLDINSGKMENRNMEPLSPIATTPSPTSPFSPTQMRGPQSLNQSGLSSLSSKPTTSSLLLSLRRFNSSSRLSTAGSPLSEMNPAPALTTCLSQTHLDNDKDKPNPLLSPSSISSKTTDTAPLHSPRSPLSTNHREKTVFQTRFYPDKPKEKNTEGSRQPKTITRAQSSLLTSKQALVSRGLTERHQNFRGPDTNLFSQNFGSSPRPSNEHSPCILPRRTTLTSTSWWKQVSQEGSSPPELNDTMSMKDKSNTPCAPPSNNNNKSDLVPDIKRFNNSQIANNRHNNNTTESVCKSSMNPLAEPQGGSQNLNQRISEDSPEHDSDKLFSQQNGSRFNNREPQKPQSLPDAFSRSKISRATAPTILSHPKGVREDDESEKSFTAGRLPPTLLNPKAVNAPTESTSQHQNNQCALNTNSSITSPHSKDSQSSIPPPLSPATTNILSSQPLIPKTGPENYKTDASFHSLPVSGQKNILTQSHTDSSSQPSTFTVGVTPSGFEKSYDYVTKTFQPKTLSTLVPTSKVFCEADTIPVSTSVSTTVKQPAATNVPSTPLLTPSTISSLLTPPATPNITSPDSDSSSPREGSDFSSSQDRDSKKQRSEGKRERRVTWEDSVDLQHSEPITVKTQEPSQVPTSPRSTPRSSPSNRAQSVFSFVRSSSPSTNAYPLCSPANRTTSMQVEKGGKYRSFSSDSADLASKEKDKSKLRLSDPLTLDQKTQEVPISRQGRTLSVESGTVQGRSSAALSLPDFTSGYKLRYSSPPYSTLMSARSTQGETKPLLPRSQLFQQSLNYTPHLSKNIPLSSAMTSPTTKASPTLVSSLQPSSPPLQSKPLPQERSNFGVSETYQLNNNNSKTNSQDRQNSQIFLINNRVHIGSRSPQGAKAQESPPTCVTETLVYSVKPKGDAAASKNNVLQPLQQAADRAVIMESKFSQRPRRVQSQETAGKSGGHLEQSSSGSSSTDSHSTDEGRRKMKDSVLFKSKFFSVESNNEQSPKKNRFALKKSISTPNSNLSRSESDRANKTNNRVDQVLSRLKQTFSTRRTDDDVSFPWKWRRGSQTPSISGSSDISSDAPAEAKTSEKLPQEKEEVLKDSEKEAEDTNQWTHKRHLLLSTPTSGGSAEKFYVRSEKSASDNDHVQQSPGTEHMSENKIESQLAIQSPKIHPFDLYKDNRTDFQPPNQLLSSPDPSPGRSSNLSAGYPPQFRKSTPSPRSPFSPFNSLSPLSPFPSPEVADDVFYSPKLQRRMESPSPREEKPGEGFSLSDSRRTRISTGPPSPCPGPGQDQNGSASLKYGIKPRRLFSVSSIQSCRPSGPGRISTGSRFMSVGDLSEPALTGEGTRKDLDQWSVSPDWTTKYDSFPSKDRLMSYFPSDPSKMRTRSLPRSLTRRLANWSSEVSDSPPKASTSKPTRLWSPNSMNTCHFTWDTEGPPTPPPTPPLSPVPRRMSKPPSLSPPACPLSPGPQQADSPASRGHLPSRGYVSSLSPYKESSDSSSDTTTDDEYYLETGEDDKETEL